MYTKGDVVKLKSGGPLMTVVLVKGDGNMLCNWFPNNETAPLSQSFPVEALETSKTD